MIHPERLQILVDLRKQARPRLSQKSAAERLGLDSNQGRKTVGDWELGKYAPSETKRRTAFIGYLWDTLGLRRDPQQFEAVWQILVEEWNWQPIDNEEWRTFTNVPRPGQEVQVAGGGFPLPAPEPKPLPESRNFVGRKIELQDYFQQLEETGYAVITGPAGIGKTALAARLATQTATIERIFWHVCYAEYDVNAFIWDLAEFLAWRGENEIWHMLHAALQTGAAPPTNTVLDYLFRTLRGQDILLCFDDFHYIHSDPTQKNLLDRLNDAVDAKEVKLIATAQITIDFGRGNLGVLAGMSYDDTCRLLHTQGTPLTEPVSQQLYQATEGNAELLILAIQSLQKSAEPAVLIQRLVKTEQVKLFLLEEVDRTLQDEERMVMYGVAALLGYPGTADAIEEVLNSPSVRYTLTHLVNRYLLEEELTDEMIDETYRQHTIVQTFYYELLGRNEKKEMHLRAADYYEHDEGDTFKAALHYQHARQSEQAAKLATEDLRASLYRGRARPLRQLLEKFSQRQLSPELWGQVLVALGQVYNFLEEWQLALQSYEQAADHLSPLPQMKETRLLQIEACRGAALVLRLRTPEEAMQWLEKGLLLSEGLDPIVEADLQIQIGILLIRLDNGPKAEEQIERGLTALNDLVPSTRVNRIRLLGLNNLGIHHYYQNDLEKTQRLWTQALELATQNQDPFNGSTLRSNLAALYQTKGLLIEAETNYKIVLGMADKLGMRAEMARIQTNMGVLYLESGDHKSAEIFLRKALDLSTEIDQTATIISSLTYLGDLCLRTTDLEQAHTYLGQAHKRAEEQNITYQIPTIMTLWAECHLQQNQPNDALVYAKKAVESAQKLGMNVALEPAQAVLNKIRTKLDAIP